MEIDMVILFRAELRNLTLLENLLDYKKKQLDKILYQMQGVRGIDPSTEHTGEGTDFDRILDLMPKKDELMNDIAMLTIRIQNIYKILDTMNEEDRRLITEIYVNGVTFEEMSQKEGYSVRQLKRKAHKILKMSLGTA